MELWESMETISQVVSVKKSTKKSKSSIQVKFLGYETTESKFVEYVHCNMFNVM